MEEMIITTNRPKFLNPELEKATLALMRCDMTIKARQFDIAAILAQVDERKLYIDDGFSSTQEYANQTFGMQKSLAYALIEVGRNYTRPILSTAGKTIGHCSNLLPPASPEKQDAPIVDFTTGQLSRVFSLGRDKVKELVEEGTISPSMTYKQLDALVKSLKQPAIEGEMKDEPEQEPEPKDEPETKSFEVPLNGFSVRTEMWDELTNANLIMELRKRGFIVYDSDGNEKTYNW